MIETGSATLRRRLTSQSGAEFPFLGEFHAAGMTDYFAVIDRLGADTSSDRQACRRSAPRYGNKLAAPCGGEDAAR